MKSKKVKRAKLIPVKELRGLYAEALRRENYKDLRINRLENEVESQDGARQNLRTMFVLKEKQLEELQDKYKHLQNNYSSLAKENAVKTIVANNCELQLRAHLDQPGRTMVALGLQKMYVFAYDSVKSALLKVKNLFVRK